VPTLFQNDLCTALNSLLPVKKITVQSTKNNICFHLPTHKCYIMLLCTVNEVSTRLWL